jgi:hypothetical protein
MVMPKGRYDDLADGATMAISFLRSSGSLRTDVEAMAAEQGTVTYGRRRYFSDHLQATRR